jgi:phosphoglycerol transferase MdoB-like AlkP superfamily enzyme
MVTGSGTVGIRPDPVPTAGAVAARRVGAAATRFLYLVPAMLLASLCLRAAELAAGVSRGTALADAIGIATPILFADLFTWVRCLPLLFLVSLPALLLRSRRASSCVLGATWTLLVVLQAALIQYFLVARVPLGADLFAYSWRDIQQTVAGGFRLDAAVVLGSGLALACLWRVLLVLARHQGQTPPRFTALVFGLAFAALLHGPPRLAQAGSGSQDTYNLSLNKTAFFVEESAAYLARSAAAVEAGREAAAGAVPTAAAAAGFRYLDPRYPFLHAEQTPDELGAHFVVRPGAPPNLVFVIVEGLGRGFSGPGATLGSFTPFLDRLASQSLYWENFLAVQGRTFAVLPSLFGSLPFADSGFNDLGERMPEHATLLSVLKSQGYRLKFFTGTDLDFDEQRAFLQRQGVDVMVDRRGFGPGYAEANDWGYADGELVSRALAEEARDTHQPFVSIVQTVTSHTPYVFPGQERYYRRFEERLTDLRLSETEKEEYRTFRDMYASVLYADDALRRYFEQMKKLPSYGNTIFIVTGDHRLPEIPMATRIDRYHVPLMIFSPLLKAPARIRSVSSHFDITPSLLAFLSQGWGIRTPAAVTWMGSGLDLDPAFRNVHELPLKQNKTDLVDYVSGTWFLSNDILYRLGDGMDMSAVEDPAVRAQLQARFRAFRAANNRLARSLALMPPGTATQLVADDAQQRRPLPVASVAAPTPAAEAAATVTVHEVRAPGRSRVGQLAIEVVLANDSRQPSEPIVPLIVLLTASGREVSESYGPPMSLAAGQSVTLQLPVNTEGVAAGRYFLAVIPSDPDTGKRVGEGRYHIPIVIDG